MTNGYALIDCTGVDLGDLGTVTGLYSKIKNALRTGKPLILENIVNSTQGFSPINAYGGSESSTSVFLSFFPITLHVNSSDVVSM